uniref:Polyglutamine-binding protein 1 n=1 Tax=Ciona intestinalis TaxID=7719 RepID=F6YDE8_CIOIN|nr:polyglutamine-binding protein 1-like [Ciona intestinalis]|eukprot:XP_009858953.1 polyglutamine-binding protein 1-like [Ciona intestinalis]
MPLPAALAARLAKRGIVSSETQDSSNPDEEVIAEDYDIPGQEAHVDEFGKHLPPMWEKVWEPSHETWYYWDTVNDKVSWLPPTDPDAKITNPAPKKSPFAPAPLGERANHFSEPVDYRKEEKKSKHKSAAKRKAPRPPEEFDPMDPSSYSDAPRGKWSVGLKKVDDAKSGVDSTANGPLFQQRPYPSPGEVLSRNKQARREVGPLKPR